MKRALTIKARYGLDLSIHYEDIVKFAGDCYFEDNKIMVLGDELELGTCIDITKRRYGQGHVSVLNADTEVICTII